VARLDDALAAATVAAGSSAVTEVNPQHTIIAQHSPQRVECFDQVRDEQLRFRFHSELASPCVAVRAYLSTRDVLRDIPSRYSRSTLVCRAATAWPAFMSGAGRKKLVIAAWIAAPDLRLGRIQALAEEWRRS